VRRYLRRRTAWPTELSTFESASSAQALREERVAAELAGERVDRVAASLFPEHSRTRLAACIRDGRLTLDGRRVSPKHRVTGGERLLLAAAPDTPDPAAAPRPQAVPFRIVYEDGDLLVIDKPAGVVVHPGAGRADATLVNGLVRHRPGLAALPRAGLVHRLDKDTTGLLLVGANPFTLLHLSKALARREVNRRYRAVAEGVLTGGRTVEAPIERDPSNRLRQRVGATGRHAVTRVRVLDRYRAHTLIEAELETGRTHQIRVHMSAIGHPLVGDTRYGARGRLPPAPRDELTAIVRAFRRQALHACRLAFVHPRSGQMLEHASPDPADLEGLISALDDDRVRHA